MQVFVYGTLKRGHGNNRLLHGAKCHGPATTVGRWRMLNGSFPVVLPVMPFAPAGHVVGELYTVDRATARRLDSLESNGQMYQRQEVTVQLENGLKTRAWMYVGCAEYWHEFGRDLMQPHNDRFSWPCNCDECLPSWK